YRGDLSCWGRCRSRWVLLTVHGDVFSTVRCTRSPRSGIRAAGSSATGSYRGEVSVSRVGAAYAKRAGEYIDALGFIEATAEQDRELIGVGGGRPWPDPRRRVRAGTLDGVAAPARSRHRGHRPGAHVHRPCYGDLS